MFTYMASSRTCSPSGRGVFRATRPAIFLHCTSNVFYIFYLIDMFPKIKPNLAATFSKVGRYISCRKLINADCLKYNNYINFIYLVPTYIVYIVVGGSYASSDISFVHAISQWILKGSTLNLA
jgi:hypothetical protein